jgi:hypothetical protein
MREEGNRQLLNLRKTTDLPERETEQKNAPKDQKSVPLSQKVIGKGQISQ